MPQILLWLESYRYLSPSSQSWEQFIISVKVQPFVQKCKEEKRLCGWITNEQTFTGGNDGDCPFTGLVRGILRDVDFLNVVLKLLKTVGFWKCGEGFSCVTSSYLSVHLQICFVYSKNTLAGLELLLKLADAPRLLSAFVSHQLVFS